MADTPITPTTISTIEDTSAARSQIPAYYSGSYDNDALYHIFRVNSSGKARLSYAVNNESNQDVVVYLYGGYSAGTSITDDDVFAIDSTGITATASGGKVYDVCSDPFAVYYIRTKAALAGDAGEVNIYVSLMAY